MKLSDVCFEMHQGINTVADKVKYYECGTPILQSKNITNGILDLEDVRFVNENDYNKYKEKYIPHKGNILLSNIGTIGKSLLIEEEKNFLIAWNIFLIKVNESKINSKFLNFYFQYLDMSNYYNKYLTGGTVKFINKKTMENIEIPNISLVNQIEIANKLEKVQKMIDIRKKQIEELDELIKSQFVEMFEKEKNEEILNNICKFINGDRGKNYPSSGEFVESGIPFINAGLIKEKKVNWKEMNYITEEKYNKLGSGKIQKDDVLYCLRGSLGKHCIIDVERKGAIASSLVILRANKEKILPEYLLNILDTDEIIMQQEQANNGSSQPNLSAGSVKKYKIKLPNIKRQEEFVNIVKQIDKQKFEIQKNLEEMQKLQESLMNKYFG